MPRASKTSRWEINRTKPPKGAPRGCYFSQEAADRTVNFIQALKHTKGRWGPGPGHPAEPFILLPWQRKIVEEVFGWLRPNGYRLYKTVYIEIPKKDGKSELAAAIALYLLFADGEAGAEVYGAAKDRNQARIVFDVAAEMVRLSPPLLKRCKIIDSVKRIVVYKSSSFYRVLSKESKAKEGFNVSGVIFDELHTQPNRDLLNVLTKGAGAARQQPLNFVITTAGIDRNSICREMHDKARQILNGNREDPTFYPVIYGPPEDDEKWDWESEDNWRAVNPSLGVILDIAEMREAFKAAKGNVADENDFKQRRLNIWVKQNLRWMPMAKWDKCGKERLDPGALRGQPCWAGIDLSATTDLTALALVFRELTGETKDEAGVVAAVYKYRTQMHFWVPEERADDLARQNQVEYRNWIAQGYMHATPGNVIDYAFIRHTLRQIRAQYDLRELAYDRLFQGDLFVQGLSEEGFLVEPEEIKRNPHSSAPVVVPFGQGFISMSPPTKGLMMLVLQERLEHYNNPVLRWCADNMVVRFDPAGGIKPDKAKATQKIDGMVALIMALDRAMRHGGENGPSIYEKPGQVIAL